MKNLYEVKIRLESPKVEVTSDIFRSWSGTRFLNGKPYTGSVYYLGTNTVVE